MLRVFRARIVRLQLIIAVIICFACPVWAASTASDLLPVGTDIILTLNACELLKDYRSNPPVEHYLDQWRFAVNGDEKRLKDYYESQEVQKFEGITLEQFLERSSMITAACKAAGCDPLVDIDMITAGYTAGDQRCFAVIVEGRFKHQNTDSLASFFKQHLVTVNEGAGPSLEMLNGNAIVFADSRKTMDLIRSRAVELKSESQSGASNLLESGRKKHFSIVVNRLQPNIAHLLKFVEMELKGPLAVDSAISDFVIEQGRQFFQRFAVDFTAFSFGISFKNDERQLEIGLDAKSVEKVETLRVMLNIGSFLLTESLKPVDRDFARALTAIVAHQQISVKETTMIVRLDVPNAVLNQALRDLENFQESQNGNANSKSASREEKQIVPSRLSDIPIWTSGVATTDIEEIRDEPYRTGPEADPLRHRLDIYLPRNKSDFPIVVLVHGGGWDQGDNRCAGLYSSVGQFLASQGIGVVLPNYRLSPKVKHPEHVKDVASAVAWTRAHLGKYGGDIRRLYLMGHSAGGHLVSLLTTDESYLKSEGMSSSDIKGVIAVSGVYRIDEGLKHGVLLGSGPRAFRFEQQFPLRGQNSASWNWIPPGWHVTANVFGGAFGDSNEARTDASPIAHVRPGLPPFLIISAEKDLPLLGPMADDFHIALREQGCDVTRLQVSQRNHNSVMFSAISLQDPVAQAILEFLRK